MEALDGNSSDKTSFQETVRKIQTFTQNMQCMPDGLCFCSLCLKEQNDTLPNQLGKPVQNPTMKWIAELMNVIAVVTIVTNNQKHCIVTNVKPVYQQIISYFGPYALEIYGLSKGLAPTISFSEKTLNNNNYKNRLFWCER